VTWFFIALIVAVLGVAVVVGISGGATMGPVYDDRSDVVIPADRPLRASDLDRVRFNTAVRGYRMDEVDALLARLRTELADGESPADESGEVRG